MNLVMTTIH